MKRKKELLQFTASCLTFTSLNDALSLTNKKQRQNRCLKEICSCTHVVV